MFGKGGFLELEASASSLSSLSSSSSSSSLLHNWILLGIFGIFDIAVIITFLVQLISKRSWKFDLLVLGAGWILRCVSLKVDFSNVIANLAGLFFFSACCIALAQLLKTFHSQRDCPGSKYRSLKMILLGYIVFFALVVICMSAASLLVTEAFSSGEQRESDAMKDLLESVLSVLFAFSFLFISIMFFVVFFMLKDAWSYLKLVIPFYVILVGCLIFRCVINLLSALPYGTSWYTVTQNNLIASIFSEAVPGFMLVVIVLMTKPPWDGEYIHAFEKQPLLRPQSDDESNFASGADLQSIKNVFTRTGGITLIERSRVRMMEVVGSGTTATVYKSLWNSQTVALKVFHLSMTDMTQKQLNIVAHEVKTLSSLNHPNVVQLFGVTLTQEGKLGFVTEFFDLGTLSGVLATMHHDMQWSLKLRMALDIARGMAYLHDSNVLHRALRSSNVIVTKALSCKLTDIGLFSFAGFEFTSDVGNNGSMEYVAPEVLRSRHYSPASDVYSFGVLLLELASGKLPFTECSLSDFEKSNAIETGKLLVRPAPSCPKLIADIILECTKTQPSERPTFSTLERRIEALRGSVGSLQNPFDDGME